MQIREQEIKQGLGDTGTGHQGNNIKLKVFGIFQALGNEVRKQRERQSAQGTHDQFMFRKKENGRMINDHCDEGNELNHFDDPKLIAYEINRKTQKENATVTMGKPIYVTISAIKRDRSKPSGKEIIFKTSTTGPGPGRYTKGRR